jgi:hypothetical protein
MDIKPGDRVVVVHTACSFDDYDIGSTAVVTGISAAPGHKSGIAFDVKWDKPFFGDHRDDERVEVVYPEEVVKLGEASA